MLRKLSEDVQTVIRSGLVVTDTSQCVLELVENALDAKATCIAVRADLDNFTIQVVDNGHGLTKEELDIIGTRYVTSKCSSLTDLAKSIKFYGYRGESLASLRETCGVIMLISKVKGSEQSYSKVFRAGQQTKCSTVSAHDRLCVGTTVIVKDFLLNLPVRRARIQPSIEMQDIKHCLQILSIINYKVSFTLRNDATRVVVLQTKGYQDIGDALSHHCNLSKNHCLIRVSVNEEPFKLIGHISRETEPSGRFQFIYVNKRLVNNKTMYKLVEKRLANSFYLRNIGKEIKQGNNRPKEKLEAVFMISVRCPHIECDFTSDPRKHTVEFRNWDAVNMCLEKLIDKFILTECNLKVAVVENKGEQFISVDDARCNEILEGNIVYGVDVKRQKAEVTLEEVSRCKVPPLINKVDDTDIEKDTPFIKEIADFKSGDHISVASHSNTQKHDNLNNSVRTETNSYIYKENNITETRNVQCEGKVDEPKRNNLPSLEPKEGNNFNKENTYSAKNRGNDEDNEINHPGEKRKHETKSPFIVNGNTKDVKTIVAVSTPDPENPLPFKKPEPKPRIIKRKYLSEHIITESESDLTPKRKKGSWESTVSKELGNHELSISPFNSREILNNVIRNVAGSENMKFKSIKSKDCKSIHNRKFQINLIRSIRESKNKNTLTLTQQNSIEYCTYGKGYYYKYTDTSEMKRNLSQNELHHSLINDNKDKEVNIHTQNKADPAQPTIRNEMIAHKENRSEVDMNYCQKSTRKHLLTNKTNNGNIKQHRELLSPSANKTNCSQQLTKFTSIIKRSNYTTKSSKVSLTQLSKDNRQMPFPNHKNNKLHIKNVIKCTDCLQQNNKENLQVTPIFSFKDANPNVNILKTSTNRSNNYFDGFEAKFESKRNISSGMEKHKEKINKKIKPNTDRLFPVNLHHEIYSLMDSNPKTSTKEKKTNMQPNLNYEELHECERTRLPMTIQERNKTFDYLKGQNIGKEFITAQKKSEIRYNAIFLPKIYNNINGPGNESTAIIARKTGTEVFNDDLIKQDKNQYMSTNKTRNSIKQLPPISGSNLQKSDSYFKTLDPDSFAHFNPSCKPLRFNILSYFKTQSPGNKDKTNEEHMFASTKPITVETSAKLNIDKNSDDSTLGQKVCSEVYAFRETVDESECLNKISSQNEIHGSEAQATCTHNFERGQQFSLDGNCKNISITTKTNDDNNINSILDKDNSLSPIISKTSQKSVPSRIEFQEIVSPKNNNNWDIETIPTGKVIYINPKTGMSSFLNPEGDPRTLYQFQNRHWFMPKGMSPLLDLNCPNNSINKLTSSQRTAVQTIVTGVDLDDSAGAKWKGVNFKGLDKMLNTSGNDPIIDWRSTMSLNKCVFSNESLLNAKVIGQVDNKFIAALMQPIDTPKSFIVLFDQHAADERVCLENLILGYNKDGKLISQAVNPGIEPDFNSVETDLLIEFMSKVEKFGLEFKNQDNKILVTAIPLCLLKRSEREGESPAAVVTAFIRELLLTAEDFRGIMPTLPTFIADVINSEACRTAIKFGDTLTLDECKLLISKLSQCSIPFQCAHGRPVLTTLLGVEEPQPEEPIRLFKLRRNKDL